MSDDQPPKPLESNVLPFRLKAFRQNPDFERIQDMRADIPDLFRAEISDHLQDLDNCDQMIAAFKQALTVMAQANISVTDAESTSNEVEKMATINARRRASLTLMGRFLAALAGKGDDAIKRLQELSPELLDHFDRSE